MNWTLFLLVMVLSRIDTLQCRSNDRRVSSGHKGTIVYVATKIGGCPGLGAKYISQSAVVASPGNCSAMGGRINSNNREYCDLDWCVTNRLIPEGIYISAPGRCGSRYRARGSFQVYTTGCAAMGGAHTSSWELCHMDFCVGPKLNDTVIYPTKISKCPNGKVAYGIIRNLKVECLNMGGAWNLNPGMYDWINCHLDFCEAQTVKDNPVVHFPFDSNNGTIWMNGSNLTDAPENSLTTGKIDGAISTNGTQWVYLEHVSEACMVQPGTCKYGGTVALWIKVHSCAAIINSHEVSKTGFSIYCSLKVMWYYLFVCDGRFSEGKRIPDGWFHVALVYNTTCSQLKVYQNGVLVERATKVSQNYIPGSGKVKIGYGFTYRHEYGSVIVDDLKFWNRPLTDQEIQELANIV